MKVIKEPSNVVLCNNCDAILEFETSDIKIMEFISRKCKSKKKYVKCPRCNNEVYIWNKG